MCIRDRPQIRQVRDEPGPVRGAQDGVDLPVERGLAGVQVEGGDRLGGQAAGHLVRPQLAELVRPVDVPAQPGQQSGDRGDSLAEVHERGVEHTRDRGKGETFVLDAGEPVEVELVQLHGGGDERAHAVGDTAVDPVRLCSELVPAGAREPVDLVGAQRCQGRVHHAEVLAVAEDVTLRRGVGVVDVPDLDLGVLLLELENDLLQTARVRPPPCEDDPAVLVVGVLLGPEDLLDDPLGDRPPETGVPVGADRPVAVGRQRRVQQQHALREHRLEPLRRLDGVLFLQQRANVGYRGLLGVLPVVEGVVEHGDAGGALRPRVRVLPEDDDLPLVRRVGLERLEGQFADGDDLRAAARADEGGRVRLCLDDRLQQRKPRFTSALEQFREGERVVRVRRGGGVGIAHGERLRRVEPCWWKAWSAQCP